MNKNLMNSDVSYRAQQAELPRKRPVNFKQWIMLVLGIYVTYVAADLILFNSAWNWPLVASYMFSERVLQGLMNTIWLTVLALVLGLLAGLVVCMGRLSNIFVIRTSAITFIWVIRATPPLVILLLIYFLGVLTPTLGVGLPFGPRIAEWQTNELITPFSAAAVGLSLYVAGKTAEIFRSGFLAIDTGQHEATKALGLSRWTALTKVQGPQAIRVIIPPLANEVVTMFKNTSLVSIVGFAELLTTVQRIYAINYETIPMLTVACVWYLALTSVLMAGQMWLEHRFERGFKRRKNGPRAHVDKLQLSEPALSVQ